MTGLETDEEMIVNDVALGFSADNYDELDEQIDPAKFGVKLVQSNSQKGTLREFQIYDQSRLFVSSGNIKGEPSQKYRINLAWVHPEPHHNKLVDWNWLVAALVFGGLSIMFLVLGLLEMLAIDYCMIGGSISFTLTLLATLIFIYKLRNEFTFFSRFGGADLFVLENKRPSQRIFDGFFIELQQAIEQAQHTESVTDRLVGELKMCRRLKDDGIIDEDTYTNARTAIFQHEQYRA